LLVIKSDFEYLFIYFKKHPIISYKNKDKIWDKFTVDYVGV